MRSSISGSSGAGARRELTPTPRTPDDPTPVVTKEVTSRASPPVPGGWRQAPEAGARIAEFRADAAEECKGPYRRLWVMGVGIAAVTVTLAKLVLRARGALSAAALRTT